MNKKFQLLFVSLIIALSAFSQKKDLVLLTVDEQPITSSEFLRVYHKNLDLVQDESQKDVDAYLNLFIDYQLKLSEARRLKLDEDKKYIREFSNYKKQLTKNYLSESKVTEHLVKEAYERMTEDIKAAHILVILDPSETDTLKVYNQVLQYRDRVLNEGFDTVKADVHNGKTVFAEDLGYFSAFKMVYDFETAAFNTKVGEISMPFRTSFGYHIVKVLDKRPSRGTITAAHIMVALKQKDSTLDPQVRINEIYRKINQGESFESLAKQFSDDKSSAAKGGKLAPFKSGQLSSAVFEDTAFNLKEDGDISKPFKTQYGWHIVKRIKKDDVQTFEQAKTAIETKVKRDSRSKLINESMVEELKKRYKIAINDSAKAYFESLIKEDYFDRAAWKLPDGFQKGKMMFTINDQSFTYDEFAKHLTNVQRRYTNRNTQPKILIDKEFNSFFERSILKYREDNLEFENEDFANILKEYRDGLLLFDLMEKEIWNKASKDTLGLQEFYEANKANYSWKDRIDIVMASSADRAIVEKVSELLEAKTEETIKKAVNTSKKQNVIFTNGIYDTDDPKLPVDLDIKEGISSVYYHNDAYHVIDIKDVLPSRIKTLEEAKGNVINDYQNKIETDWLTELKNRFKVEVNKKALKKIKSKLKK